MKKITASLSLIALFFCVSVHAEHDYAYPDIKTLEVRPELPTEISRSLFFWSLQEYIRHKQDSYIKASMALTMAKIFDAEKFFDQFYVKERYYDFNLEEFSRERINAAPPVSKKQILKAQQRLRKSGGDNAKIAWYVYDFLAFCDPDNEEYKKIKENLPRGNWEYLAPGIINSFNEAPAKEEQHTPAPIDGEISVPEGYRSAARMPAQKEVSINGLIVSSMHNSRKVGMPALISARSILSDSVSGRVFLDEEVGADMKRSLSNAALALRKRYPFIPEKHNVQVSFDERDSNKDGNSAGVAFTLLLYALYEGLDLDQSVAVTGVILTDCSIKAVGGVPEKVLGASKKGLKIAIIPEENKQAVNDMILLFKPHSIWDIQIFSAKRLTEVLKIAPAQKAPAVQEAIERFEAVAAILSKGGSEIKKNRMHLLSEIDSILQLAPNHESAKSVRRLLSGKRPKYLSIPGSVDFLMMFVDRTLALKVRDIYRTSGESLKYNKGLLSKNLRYMAPEARSFGTKLLPYIDALITYRDIMAKNIHRDWDNIGTAFDIMDREAKKMEKTQEELDKIWKVLSEKL